MSLTIGNHVSLKMTCLIAASGNLLICVNLTVKYQLPFARVSMSVISTVGSFYGIDAKMHSTFG